MSGFRKNTFEVKWRIENVNSWLQTRNNTLYSPEFLAETLANSRWKLSLSTNRQLAEKYLSLTVQRDVEDNGPELALHCELSVLASDESPLTSITCTKKFASKTVSHELNVEKMKILFKEKGIYLPENALSVCCKFWKVGSTFSEGGHCTIRSVIGTRCVTLDGAIDNYDTLSESSNVTVNFMSPSSDITFISFHVHLKWDNVRHTLYFERIGVDCNCFRMYSCKLFVLDAKGRRIFALNNTNLWTLLSSNKECSFSTSYAFYKQYLQDGTLKLQLEITYYPGVESESIEYDVDKYKRVADEPADLANTTTSHSEKVDSSQLSCIQLSEYEEKSCDFEDAVDSLDAAGKKHLPFNTLKEDLISLHDDRLFCDTKLQTDTETFPAHRCVLSARSPVFKKMFTTDMKEAAGECINILDINSDTVRRMLRFLYTNSTGDLEMQSAKDLYTASDKYDIASLKQRCSTFMKKSLCPANVCEVLVLADMYQDKDLESAAQEYVLTYDKEVLGSEEWKLFMKKFSSLAAQVMYLKCMKE